MEEQKLQQIVSLNDVGVEFVEDKPILSHLNLSVQQNEWISILGANGCGKSTLLKLIVGLVKPKSGSVKIFNQDMAKLTQTESEALHKRIGIAFQQGALFDFMTVRENILFAMENMTNFSKEEQEKRVKNYLNAVNLTNVEDKLPSELSGGMRRRVGIVRAMVTSPNLVLLDEPTAGLDPVTTSVVIDMIHKLGEKTQATMICVTSSVDVAYRFSNRVGILKDGRIIGVGTKEELLQSGDSWIANFLTLHAMEAVS